MKKIYLLITAGAFLGAAIYILLPSKSSFTSQSILEADDFYSQSIQPIFDAKCIACHSCYNSPCQLKLTSFYSTQRGANKISIYDFPKLEAREPTRMFVDAKDINGWRKKGFYSITDKADQSILNHMVSNLNGIESGLQSNYQSEQSRVCIDSTSQDNINMYINENPAGRMPYGLPALEKKEIDLISTWQNLGSPGPQIKKQERKILEHEDVKDNVKKWESFFNRSSLKARLSSRYIYEHLFLANIYFDESFKVNFRLVRSRTRSGAIDEIATDYPFDDPGANFYYRLRPVLETIVHKSHIPFKFTDEKMKKWNKSFYISQWEWHPKSMPAYGRAGANPYKTFAAIPVKARYQFFLDESSYHIMTFIKGPVCRGQTALNVINDHFWVFFLDPSKDPLVNSKELYNKVSNKMSLPAELKDDFAPLVNLRKNYWRSIKDKYEYLAQKNLGLDWLWSGDKSDLDASITVMRHFDSAQVMQGLQGKTPKTAWVLDYQVFESIYYNLSAGYNVFGPLLHQVNSRLFMEISRVSSEDLFLTFLPQESRVDLRDKWNVPTPKEKESPLKWVVDLFTDDAQV